MYHLFASLGFGSNHDGANLFDASTFIGSLYRLGPQMFDFLGGKKSQMKKTLETGGDLQSIYFFHFNPDLPGVQ